MSLTSSNIETGTIKNIENVRAWYGPIDSKSDLEAAFKCAMQAFVRSVVNAYSALHSLGNSDYSGAINKVSRIGNQIKLVPSTTFIKIAGPKMLSYYKEIWAKNAQFFIDLKNEIRDGKQEFTAEDLKFIGDHDKDFHNENNSFYTELGNLFEEGFKEFEELEDDRMQIHVDRIWVFSRTLVAIALKHKNYK